MTKTRSKKYNKNCFYFLNNGERNKRFGSVFPNGILYFYEKDDKKPFLNFALIVEEKLNLGLMKLGVSSVDRLHRQKKEWNSKTIYLKKITYEKANK